eukprot:7319382-Prymnesium_polylepis.1
MCVFVLYFGGPGPSKGAGGARINREIKNAPPGRQQLVCPQSVGQEAQSRRLPRLRTRGDRHPGPRFSASAH